jgi:hypothetical protein
MEAAMHTFDEKLAICNTFPELQRKDVSLGRVNFHYEDSLYDKKTVVYHLHPNGNGFVYAGHMKGIPTDEKGLVNIRDYTADALRQLVDESIRSLSAETSSPKLEEQWNGPDHQSLTVKGEDDLWYVYTGTNLEVVFETYEEVQQYMQEEGFRKQS